MAGLIHLGGRDEYAANELGCGLRAARVSGTIHHDH